MSLINHALAVRVLTNVAEDVLAGARERSPERDPFELVEDVATHLGAEVAQSIRVRLHGALFAEGVYPQFRFATAGDGR